MIKWDNLKNNLETNKDFLLSIEESYDLSEVAAAKYIQHLQLKNTNLKKELAAQEELNRNLIRISVERHNTERNRKAKSGAYLLDRITEINNFNVTKKVELKRCYKIRIQLAYDPGQFPLRTVKRQIERDWELIESIIGDVEYIAPNELNIAFPPGFKDDYAPNYMWDVSFEGDYIHKVWYMIFLILKT